MHPRQTSGDERAAGDATLARVETSPSGRDRLMDVLLGRDLQDDGGAELAEVTEQPAAPSTEHSPPDLWGLTESGTQTPGSPGGPDGQDIESAAADSLDYLSQLCQQLGVPDPVEEYFAPVIGRWSAMHDEAERWRAAGRTADEATASVTKPLGGLDAAWKGADADAFLDYMRRVGLAGNDLSDAMNSMAEVLDKTADGIREIVRQMAGVLADTAEVTSQAMAMPVRGEDRAREHLDEIRPPTKELFEAVRDVVEAFVRLCDGTDGGQDFDQITMAHTFPEQNWSFNVDMPQVPPGPPAATEAASVDQTTAGAGGSVGARSGGGSGGGGAIGGGGGSVGGSGLTGGGGAPAPHSATPGAYTMAGEVPAAPAAANAAGAPAGGQTTGMGGMPMMPMGAMGGGAGGGGGGDQEHKSKSRVLGNPEDIFGKPTKASPAVIGDDEEQDSN